MVRIKGRMAVNVINGRHGPFNAATSTPRLEIIWSAMTVWMNSTPTPMKASSSSAKRIFVSVPFGVGKIIEPVATLEGLHLHEAYESAQESIPEAIPDPVTEGDGNV